MDSGDPSLLFHFIDEPIEAIFDIPPTLEKSPSCPSAIRWNGEVYPVIELIAEWHDFRRRGRMGRNMAPAHAAAASSRGSWGVGRFYFRVKVESGQIFEIYFDRQPKDAGDRKGSWFLYGQRSGI
jgi:hypothetical protein